MHTVQMFQIVLDRVSLDAVCIYEYDCIEINFSTNKSNHNYLEKSLHQYEEFSIYAIISINCCISYNPWILQSLQHFDYVQSYRYERWLTLYCKFSIKVTDRYRYDGVLEDCFRHLTTSYGFHAHRNIQIYNKVLACLFDVISASIIECRNKFPIHLTSLL